MQFLKKPVSIKGKRRKQSKDVETDDGDNDTAVCSVCGDKASKYRYSHYGTTSCFSCRAFFRRTVKKSKHEIFYCSTGDCIIDVNSRKKCPYCRLVSVN